MRLNDSTLVTLGHGVHVLVRGKLAVQFGVDATRSGIVDTHVAEALAGVLRGAQWPLTITQLQEQLVGACGVDAAEARSLIDDLCAYNVLIPATPTTVAVLGTTPLAQEVRRILDASGMTVRVPLAAEDTRVFLRRLRTAPVVAVDSIHEYLRLDRPLKKHGNWVVPVMSFDSRVIIGPVGHDPDHACGMCAHMHVRDKDRQMRAITEQLAEQPRRMDPVVAAVGAATVAVTVRRLAGLPDPPGIVSETPGVGWAAVVDPLGSQPITPLDIEQHARCPVCLRF